MVELRFEQGMLCLDGQERRPVLDEDLERFRGWARRYGAAVPGDDELALLDIGREIHAWLDERRLEGLRTDRDVRFAAPLEPDADERAFLDVPWELMADRDGFWARDRVKRYVPARLLGTAKRPAEPPHADLQMLFMAAAPRGVTELDVEAEEAALRQATRGL